MRLRTRLEFKIQDMWVGVFWKRKSYFLSGPICEVVRTDYWVCLVPCFPIHIIIERRQRT